MVAPQWFRRFSEIPGVSFATPADFVDASPSADESLEPTIDDENDSLWWTYIEDGEEVSSSQSPASSAANRMPDLASLYRALNLPGELSDYHYVLGAAQHMLMEHRDRSPREFIDHFEQLCWLDIDLLEAHPDTIRDPYAEPSDTPSYYRPDVYEVLARHFLGEGLLLDAIAVAQRGTRFGHGAELVEELEQRRTRLGEEARD